MTLNKKPDDYDIEGWQLFYRLHPGYRRSVGAEGVNEPVTESSGDQGGSEVDSGDNPDMNPTDVEASEGDTEQGETEENSDSEADEKSGEDQDGEEVVALTAEDFEVPEGMEVDEGMMSEFLEIVNGELKGKDQYQALANLYAKKMQESAVQAHEAWDNVRKEWQDEVKNDPELGGKNLDKTKAAAVKVLSEYGTPELMQFLESYGMLDKADLLRMLVKVNGSKVSEDKAATGRENNQAPIEDRWYKSES